MIIENSDALKKYLMEALGRISDADPAALSRYILALLKKPRTEADLRVFFLDQLQIFLTKDTAKFVEQLFEVIKTKSYLPSEERESSPKSEKNESRGKDNDKDTQSSENHKSREKRRERNRLSTESHGKKKRSLSSSRSRSSSPDKKKIREREKDSLFTHSYLNDKGVTHTFNNRDVVPSNKPPPDPVLSNPVIPEYIVQSRNEKIPKRCKDYDERGYCLLGDSCRYNHGLDPLIVEDVSILNYAHVLNNSSVPSSLTVCVRDEKEPPPPPPPPPPPTSPPPLPPLPTTGIEYIPEPYNPECPAMMGSLDTQKDCENYYGVSLPKSFQVPSLIPSQPQSLLQSRLQNSKPIRSRELIGVPTVDSKTDELLSLSRKRKRDNRLYLGTYPHAKQKRIVAQATNTLELRRVPPKLNNITALHEHFCTFGKILNIQVCYDDDPEAALVTFESPAEAAAAYKSTEAVLNNRFIKVLLHDPEKRNDKNKDNYFDKDRNDINDKKEENNMSHTNTYTQRNFRPRKGLFESVVYSKGNLSKTVFLAKSKADASSGSLPPQGMASKDEKKHALSKLDLYKKKQEFLEAQIQHHKMIFERLQTCRNAKQKEVLKKMIEDLAEKITTLQNELKSVFQKEKSNSQKSVAERKKELLDAEMDLYKTLNKGQSESDTSALLMKVHELKEKAKALGEKSGLKIKRPPLTNKSVMNFSKLLKTDKRPKTLLVTGIEDKDFLVNFLQKFPGIEKINPVSTGCTLTLQSRKVAETMLKSLNGFSLGEENLSVSWYQEDQQSVSEDVKDTKEKKDSLDFGDADGDVVDGDGDEDEDEEDSESRSWRR